MAEPITLASLGWNARFEQAFAPHAEKGWIPARIIRDNKITYGALTAGGEEYEVIMAGRVYHQADTDADLPAVGDWVALDTKSDDDHVVIRARLPRQSCLSRKLPGRSAQEQIIATNIDVVVVITDPGPDLNLRRMERYFTMIALSGARPIVLVNKADIFPEAAITKAVRGIQALSSDAEVHVTSALKKRSLAPLKKELVPGRAVVLMGSSGVGKSSIVNAILGDEYQWTDEVNEVTGRGRHSTTARELFVLPKGGILIDNPGIREVHVWTDAETLRERFADIEDLATRCKYDDCKHRTDVGCAIQAAIAEGTLRKERYESYRKLEAEVQQLQDQKKRREITGNRWARRELLQPQRRSPKRITGHEDEG